MQTWQASLLLDCKCELAEGPMWHPIEQKLYWVDILSKRLHRYDLNTEIQEDRDFPMIISAIVPLKTGGLIIATEENFLKYDFDQGTSMELVKLEDQIPENRTNDGKCDPQGRFWIGTMSKTAAANAGTLYRLNPDLSVHPMIANTTISNGMCWSLDHRTMYYIDSPENRVFAYDFNSANGNISNQRIVIDFSDLVGVPDGMTIDTEGMLWIAHWGGSKVGRWNPNTGEMIDQIQLPVPRVTCPVFGGPNMNTLFITTAWEHMTEEQRQEFPLSGGIFSIQLPFTGIPAFQFDK